jgi:glycerol kinase
MAANDWFCQFLADVLDIAVERPANLETTALGAAMLAGHASGAWPGVLDASGAPGELARFAPALDAGRRARLLEGWHKAVQRTIS